MTQVAYPQFCSCQGPHGCGHFSEAKVLRKALERIVEMADRSDAHPDIQFGQVAREALSAESQNHAGEDA